MADTYNVITDNERTSEVEGLFGATGEDESNAPDWGGVKTAEELREEYEGDTYLESVFGTFDNYLGYMTEASDMLGRQNWWTAKGIDKRTPVDKIREDGQEDRGRSPAQQTDIDDLRQADSSARNSGYQKWLMSDENQALMQKYGIEQQFTDEKGDKYTWTGNGYMRTYVNNDARMGGMEIGKALIAGLYAYGGGAVAANFLGGTAGAVAGTATSAPISVGAPVYTAAGQAVTTGSSIASSLASATGLTAGTISTAGGAMVGSSISQLMLTGDIDPTKVLVSGVTAGILETANALQNMDPSIVTSDTMGFLYDKVDKLSELLNTDYETALDIAKAVSVGAIEGGDLEGIVKSSLSVLGADEITDFLSKTVGLEIPNLVGEGTTAINPDAVEEVARILLRDGMNGELDEGTLLSMGLGYIRNDGSFAFLDPSSLFPDSGDFDIFDGFFDGFENPFEGFDFDLKGGEGFNLDFTSNEAQALADSDTFGEYFDPNDYDNNVILQYDQGTIDSIMGIIEAAKQAGRDFDDSVLQPIKTTIQEAGYVIDDNVLQPIKDGAIALYDMLPDVSIGGPNLSGPSLSGPNLPDLPDVDTGGFKFPELNFGKPFGDELEAFNPLGAPALGNEIPLLAKVKPQNAYDPRKAGSSIVSSMFAEYLG